MKCLRKRDTKNKRFNRTQQTQCVALAGNIIIFDQATAERHEMK